ncbi:hypothetical protein RND81_14G237500 [Saponaria officinalis]|uniref:Plant basic secretory protein (BSP) family protein n=1 Tax=Saponaria officinalis TaxID=3572 RepID=A0AAW1GRI3_SAPOF
MSTQLIILITSLVVLLAYKVTAVTYGVYNAYPNSPGGVRFEAEIGSDYTVATLSKATNFIWETFQQTENPNDRKPGITRITVHVVPWKGEVTTKKNQLYISSIYIQNYEGDIRREITRVIYHELTHVWQWTGMGRAPKGLLEGIADYVKIKAGYADEKYGKKQGDGERWDEGAEITAYFLEYCNELRKGFVAELNAKMKNGYEESFFRELLGKSVEKVWDDYKDKYGHKD